MAKKRGAKKWAMDRSLGQWSAPLYMFLFRCHRRRSRLITFCAHGQASPNDPKLPTKSENGRGQEKFGDWGVRKMR